MNSSRSEERQEIRCTRIDPCPDKSYEPEEQIKEKPGTFLYDSFKQCTLDPGEVVGFGTLLDFFHSSTFGLFTKAVGDACRVVGAETARSGSALRLLSRNLPAPG